MPVTLVSPLVGRTPIRTNYKRTDNLICFVLRLFIGFLSTKAVSYKLGRYVG